MNIQGHDIINLFEGAVAKIQQGQGKNSQSVTVHTLNAEGLLLLPGFTLRLLTEYHQYTASYAPGVLTDLIYGCQ